MYLKAGFEGTGNPSNCFCMQRRTFASFDCIPLLCSCWGLWHGQQAVFPLHLCGAGCGFKTLLSFCILCFEDRQNHCLGSLKVCGDIWINVLFCRNFFMQISVCLTQEHEAITFLHGLYPCWLLLSYIFPKPLSYLWERKQLLSGCS